MQTQEPINNQQLNQDTQTPNLEETTNTNPIEDEVEKLKEESLTHYENWLRAKAELENARRRNLEDLEKMRKFCIENFAESLLSVMDSLQAALKDNSEVDVLKQGVELTLKQLQSAFDKHKIIALEPLGEKLDPTYHQAISMVPSDKEVNTIIEVVQKGYTIAERLMRPALVVVSSGQAS